MTIYIVEPPEGQVYQADSLQEHMRQEASDLIKECKKHEPMPHIGKQLGGTGGMEGLCWCTNELCPHIYPHGVLKTRKENNDVTLCNTWEEAKKIMHDEGMYQCIKCNEWMAENYITKPLQETASICFDCYYGVNDER